MEQEQQQTEGVNFRQLNAGEMKNVYEYYTEKEEWISICKERINTLVFAGEVRIDWGDVLKPKGKNFGPSHSSELVSMLTLALDYKDMFGFCPYVIDKPPPSETATNEKKKSDWLLEYVKVLPFGIGDFTYGVKNGEIVIKFTPKQKSNGTKRYGVFVWPGCGPNAVTGRLHTNMFKLYKRYTSIVRQEKNLEDADYYSCHPPVFVQMRAANRSNTDDLDKMMESEIYADKEDDEMTPMELRTYKRDLNGAKRLEMLLDVMNEQNTKGILNEHEDYTSQKVLDDATGTLRKVRKRKIWEENMISLPDQMEVAKSSSLPNPRKDLEFVRSSYEEAVCLSMGIPKGYATMKGHGLKAEAQQEHSSIKRLVLSKREAANKFFQAIYEDVFRDTDDEYILQELMSINKTEDKKRLKAIYKVAALKSRVSLLFEEDPLPPPVTLSDILTCQQRGILSGLETLNMCRSLIGKPQIRPDTNEEFVNEFLKRTASLSEQQQKLPPPPQGILQSPKKKEQKKEENNTTGDKGGSI
jgi:hypothetical protein